MSKLPNLPPEELIRHLLELVDLLSRRACIQRKDLGLRYNRTVRTIDVWKADGTLPPPKWFHGPLWTPLQILEAEKAGILVPVKPKAATPADRNQLGLKF